MLTLRFLGPPRIEQDGRLVSLVSPPAVALLASLALERGPQPRQVLAGRLWPAAPAREGHRRLERILGEVEETLGEGWLEAGPELIAFSRRPAPWIDSERFWELVHDRSQDTSGRLAEAVHLYRGGFLDGFSLPESPAFATWQTTQAGRLEGLLGETCTRLIDDCLDRQKLEAALRYARRWSLLAPTLPAARRALDRIYAQCAGLREGPPVALPGDDTPPDEAAAALAAGRFRDGRGLTRAELARRLARGDLAGAAGCLERLGRLDMALGRWPAGEGSFARAAALRRGLDEKTGLAAALLARGEALLAGGRPEAAETPLRECLAIYRQAGNQAGAGRALAALGQAALMERNLLEAGWLAREGEAACRQAGDFTGSAAAAHMAGVAAFQRGELPQALEAYLRALAALPGPHEGPLLLDLLVDVAEWLQAAGAPSAAALLLAVVRDRPTCGPAARAAARELWSDLDETLSAAEKRRLIARGEALDPQTAVVEALAAPRRPVG